MAFREAEAASGVPFHQWQQALTNISIISIYYGEMLGYLGLSNQKRMTNLLKC